MPRSARHIEDERLTGLIKQFWLESGGIYGYRKIHRDLRDIGERCGKQRVRRLMRLAGLRAQVGYRRPRQKSGPASVVAPNRLQQQCNVAEPNEAWVSDITHIRTHEGWLYLAVLVDLYSRRVIGWSMQSRIKKELVLDALLMAVWRRRPKGTVTVHTDQGSQYTSHDWQDFLSDHNLQASMSRRGNCHDNAVAESFFQLLKRERIKRHIYATKSDARTDIVDYIEMFYNNKRRHGFNDLLSPVECEEKFKERLASVQRTRSDSVSRHIRAMPFLWLDIPDLPGNDSLRGYIERNSIALPSNYRRDSLDEPSSSWLGNYSDRDRVKASGMWNGNHVDESTTRCL